MYFKLHSLLGEVGLPVPGNLPNLLITSITCDSRDCKDGSLFLGFPGQKADGGVFWRDALSAGAVAALVSSAAAEIHPPSPKDPVIVLPEPVAEWVGSLASAFWGKPTEQLPLLGVTGTNGKTTTTHLIEHLSSSVGKSTALFGTLENRWPGYRESATHTTDFSDQLQEKLSNAVNSGVDLCVMEVSSHSLAQSRVAGCDFSGAVFTNLTQDHLDYHETMEKYFLAKSKLFTSSLLKPGINRAVINVDDPWGQRLAQEMGSSCWRSTLREDIYRSNLAELLIKEIEINSSGFTKGLLISPFGEGYFSSRLCGHFNLMNILQAVGILLQQGFSMPLLLNALSDFPGVPGRMERVILSETETDTLPLVLVDYAHTPDGLKNALMAARPFAKNNIICVFGCGGDRDRLKRPLMGKVAAKYADSIIITSDNPRTEEPQGILRDIGEGIPIGTKMIYELDRKTAINEAIKQASETDLVLIAGKGHEDYQILGTSKIHFDDREIAASALRKRRVSD